MFSWWLCIHIIDKCNAIAYSTVIVLPFFLGGNFSQKLINQNLVIGATYQAEQESEVNIFYFSKIVVLLTPSTFM